MSLEELYVFLKLFMPSNCEMYIRPDTISVGALQICEFKLHFWLIIKQNSEGEFVVYNSPSTVYKYFPWLKPIVTISAHKDTDGSLYYKLKVKG